MKSKGLIVGSLAVILGTISLSQAQNPQRTPTLSEGSEQYRVPSDEEIQLLKKDIRSKRKQIIAANMNLTDAQAEKFWPIYEQYTTDLGKINDHQDCAN